MYMVGLLLVIAMLISQQISQKYELSSKLLLTLRTIIEHSFKLGMAENHTRGYPPIRI